MALALKKSADPQVSVFYPLANSSWNTEEILAIERVVKSGRFTMGENVKLFEKNFATKFNVPYALMLSSGSTANLIGVASLFYRQKNPLKRGDEVIVPAISWATTYYPLSQYGLDLRFVDVDLNTLNMDVTQLKKALTSKTKMVMAVSILGNPAALDVMRKFCDEHGLILFEDNCESMGAELNGKPCGTFGDIGTFSTFFSHHISTMEGGVLVTADEELYHIATSLRAHGWTRDLPPHTKLFKRREDDFFEAYRFILPGYNARPLEMSGAIGIEQLKKLDRMVEVRRQNAETFQRCFSDDERFIIQKENGKSSWFSFTVILNPKYKIDRAAILAAMKSEGVEYRIITGGNFVRHDVIKHIPHTTVGKMKNADIAHDLGFFIGNFPYPVHSKIEKVYEVLTSSL